MRTLFHCLIFSLALCPEVIHAQTVQYEWTTIAGAVGSTGTNDGINSNARFNFPGFIAVDNATNLYVSDVSNFTIRKIAPTGTNWVVTTIAGAPGTSGFADGTNSQAQLGRPNGLAMDAAGKLFMADRYNHTIRQVERIGTDWVVRTLAGGGPSQRGDSDGTNDQARFYGPAGVAVDGSGFIYVADSANFTIRGVAPIGTNWVVSTLAGTPLDFGFEDGTNEQARFSSPSGVAQNQDGTIYMTDYGNNCVREIAPIGGDWVVRTVAGLSRAFGHADGTGSQATFSAPNGIAIDSAGAIFVTDQGNHTIRKVARNGTNWMVTTIGGTALQPGSTNATGTAARFNKPWGVAVDKSGNLYVADWLNQTIRKGTPFTPVPVLQIRRSFNQVVLTWPAWASNYVLETSSKVAPGTNWTPLTNGIAIAGGNFVLTNGVGPASTFFRLHLQ